MGYLDQITIDRSTGIFQFDNASLDNTAFAELVTELSRIHVTVRQMYFRRNEITALPKNFGSLFPDLEVLDISENPVLSSSQLLELVDILKKIPKLTTLFIEYSGTDSDEDHIWAHLPTLEMLNDISVSGDDKPFEKPSLWNMQTGEVVEYEYETEDSEDIVEEAAKVIEDEIVTEQQIWDAKKPPTHVDEHAETESQEYEEVEEEKEEEVVVEEENPIEEEEEEASLREEEEKSHSRQIIDDINVIPTKLEEGQPIITHGAKESPIESSPSLSDVAEHEVTPHLKRFASHLAHIIRNVDHTGLKIDQTESIGSIMEKKVQEEIKTPSSQTAHKLSLCLASISQLLYLVTEKEDISHVTTLVNTSTQLLDRVKAELASHKSEIHDLTEKIHTLSTQPIRTNSTSTIIPDQTIIDKAIADAKILWENESEKTFAKRLREAQQKIVRQASGPSLRQQSHLSASSTPLVQPSTRSDTSSNHQQPTGHHGTSGSRRRVSSHALRETIISLQSENELFRSQIKQMQLLQGVYMSDNPTSHISSSTFSKSLKESQNRSYHSPSLHDKSSTRMSERMSKMRQRHTPTRDSDIKPYKPTSNSSSSSIPPVSDPSSSHSAFPIASQDSSVGRERYERPISTQSSPHATSANPIPHDLSVCPHPTPITTQITKNKKKAVASRTPESPSSSSATFSVGKKSMMSSSSTSSSKTKPSLTLAASLPLLRGVLTSIMTSYLALNPSVRHATPLASFIFTYFNQKYGCRSLVLKWIRSFSKAINRFYQDDAYVEMWKMILEGSIDIGYARVQEKLEKTVQELLRLLVRAKKPLAPAKDIEKIFNNKISGKGGVSVSYREWSEIVNHIYSKKEGEKVSALVLERIEKDLDDVIDRRRRFKEEKSIGGSYVHNDSVTSRQVFAHSPTRLSTASSVLRSSSTSSHYHPFSLAAKTPPSPSSSYPHSSSLVHKTTHTTQADGRPSASHNISYKSFIHTILTFHLHSHVEWLAPFRRIWKSFEQNEIMESGAATQSSEFRLSTLDDPSDSFHLSSIVPSDADEHVSHTLTFGTFEELVRKTWSDGVWNDIWGINGCKRGIISFSYGIELLDSHIHVLNEGL
ncbi:hypothetical protein ADUPG1_013359 [Aduncisulcus paluster]|uniref:Uncharacterized protein n=1 Tax=Aduncisulcus paluster TaxID=2918883 RepID=A0ABQ5K6A7_9EUKA|nr:hypothetical protein ADUPG1_013359 [Aduncisulcus paluster]